jgi:hypothetical protein
MANNPQGDDLQSIPNVVQEDSYLNRNNVDKTPSALRLSASVLKAESDKLSPEEEASLSGLSRPALNRHLSDSSLRQTPANKTGLHPPPRMELPNASSSSDKSKSTFFGDIKKIFGLLFCQNKKMAKVSPSDIRPTKKDIYVIKDSDPSNDFSSASANNSQRNFVPVESRESAADIKAFKTGVIGSCDSVDQIYDASHESNAQYLDEGRDNYVSEPLPLLSRPSFVSSASGKLDSAGYMDANDLSKNSSISEADKVGELVSHIRRNLPALFEPNSPPSNGVVHILQKSNSGDIATVVSSDNSSTGVESSIHICSRNNSNSELLLASSRTHASFDDVPSTVVAL